MTHCPHCGERLSLWTTPAESSWGGSQHHVCFNDECSYFVKGWAWMMEQFEHKASYRYRYDPDSGANGPLPVWSAAAMRGWIVGEAPDADDGEN